VEKGVAERRTGRRWARPHEAGPQGRRVIGRVAYHSTRLVRIVTATVNAAFDGVAIPSVEGLAPED